MKRRDQGRASLVDFLQSLKFSRRSAKASGGESTARFARLDQRIRPERSSSIEDFQLVRSAN